MPAELRIENDDQKKVVPSAIYNNLSFVGGLRVFGYKKEAVVLKPSSVRLLSLDARSSSSSKKRQTVSHVSAATVEGKLTATVTAGDSLELWDLAKETIISSTQITTDTSVVAQCSAVGTNNGASFAVTGASNGDVAVFSVNSELQTTPLARQSAHAACVNAIGVSPSPTSTILFATGDANGTVTFWNRSMHPSTKVPPNQSGDCVTSIVSDGEFFIVAYGGGKVRLFNANTGVLTVEIAAHARWINAVAVEPTAHHLATCADDGAIFVWQLPTANSPQMKLIGQKFIKNYLWTGLAFGEAGQLFASAYDVDRAYTFSY